MLLKEAAWLTLPFAWSEPQFFEESPYTILSHTWEDTDSDDLVNIEGDLRVALGSYHIPNERLNQLCRALQIFKSSQTYFWLDAVCIDQADRHITGRQVSLMNKIYRGSEQTLQELFGPRDLDQKGGRLAHPVSDNIDIEMSGTKNTRQRGRLNTSIDTSNSPGNGDYDPGKAFPCIRRMLKVLKRMLDDDLHAGFLVSTPIPKHQFTPGGLGGVRYMMENAGNAGSNRLFDGNSENLESGEYLTSSKLEKLLRLQRARNGHNLWPPKFRKTQPFNLKFEYQLCKPSLLKMFEEERISNTDQHHTLDRQLKSHHINLIALSATIGTGIFLSPSLLLPLIVTILILWPFILYALRELAADFPMGIVNSWIESLNLHQKLPQFVVLNGAAFSILQIMNSVAEAGSLEDALFTGLFVISRLAVCFILYYTVLKAISWIISEIRLLIQTCMEGCTKSLLGHRSSRSKCHAGQALIMSFLLWTTPVTAIATSLDTSTISPCSSFLDALYLESGKLFSLFTTPKPPFPRTIPAPTLLLALLLTTSLTVILYTLLRHNTSTKYLLCTSVCLALLLGSVSAVDIPDLVFRYLFLGFGFGLMTSAFESVTKVVRVIWRNTKRERERKVGKRGFMVEIKDMEAGREHS
ncbi:hypothetical protein NA56DRAFT_747744 [Hyaloscypha hepaticicola]|uniref:Heterokaryon incompatibility domain-containing protein n=1 Tax=Hyaloscypha hepaticicola TaxID=2082293 RepID=A0A2J6Q8B3_9HELO|nr:hypothetical protein NA56DRAFT_747744 [Hyaloscypha hepaticicola]